MRPRDSRSEEFRVPDDAQPLRSALSDLARSAAAGTATCSGGCAGATSGTASAHCSLVSTPMSCRGGGSASGTGTVDFSFNCAPPRTFSATYSFSLGFTGCTTEGVTLTSSSPVTISGNITMAGDLTLSVSTSSLHVTGNYCARTIDQTCSINFNATAHGPTYAYSGTVCGCDLAKLGATQDVCTASCWPVLGFSPGLGKGTVIIRAPPAM
jgi:hypothetical protein